MLAPWKESFDKPRQHIKQQRHPFHNKGLDSQSYGFSIVLYGCVSLTIKKAERWRTDTFKLWCLRVPWTARRSNQSVLKEINPEYSLEGLMLKLKLQYVEHLMYSLEKTLMLEKIEARGEGDDRRWDGWLALPTIWTWVWAKSGREWRTGKPGVLWFMGCQRVRNNLATEQR